MKTVAGLTMMLAVAGCDRGATTAAAPATPGVPAPAPAAAGMMASVPTNAWLGRWVGPEGLFLEIAADGGAFSGRYRITNQYTLDDKGEFTGLASMDTIVFKRAGREIIIRAGNGDATGMKWLAGKRNCLILGPGEGYCRD